VFYLKTLVKQQKYLLLNADGYYIRSHFLQITAFCIRAMALTSPEFEATKLELETD
jgi:hypothetical protein